MVQLPILFQVFAPFEALIYRVASSTYIKCSMGNVALTLSGSERNYNYTIECAMGNIDIGDHNYSGLSKETSIDQALPRPACLSAGFLPPLSQSQARGFEYCQSLSARRLPQGKSIRRHAGRNIPVPLRPFPYPRCWGVTIADVIDSGACYEISENEYYIFQDTNEIYKGDVPKYCLGACRNRTALHKFKHKHPPFPRRPKVSPFGTRLYDP